MTEREIRSKVVSTAKSWFGLNEKDGSHMQIVGIYNGHTPLARGYRVQRNDSWCAATVSAVAIRNELTDIMPTECSCGRMIELYKAMGRWHEGDNYVPSPADIIMFDWDDDGKGDCTGWPEHVGIVVSVDEGTVKCIEGNKNDAVGYRTIKVDGKYIRGYCLPDYASKAEPERPIVTPAAPAYTLELFIRQVQAATGSQVDGIAGPETLGNTPTISAMKNRRHPCVEFVQRRLGALGYTMVGDPDGIAGPLFTKAVKRFQRDNGCVVDGEITAKNKTWRKLLGMG